MPEIAVNDYYFFVMFLLACGFLLWELVTFLRFKGKILVSGSMPSAKIAFGLTAVIFVVVFLRNFGISPYSVTTTALYVMVLLFAMFLNCGVTEKGVVIQGFLSRYEKMRYYNIDYSTAKNPRLRVGMGFQEKFIEIKEADVQLVCAYFVKNEVPSFDEFVQLKKEKQKNKEK